MIVRLTVWMIFLTVPIWLFGVQSCEDSAWWNDEDKIKKYIEITSPKLAGLLIPKYSGYSTYIRTNIPALYNQYIVNKYPTRLAALGLVDYCVTVILGGWYGVCITAYFWFGRSDNIPVTIILLIVHSILFRILSGWNSSRVKSDELEVISKVEMKKRSRRR